MSSNQDEIIKPVPTAQESRVKKTLLNARVSVIFYFLSILLTFFSRKIFFDCLSADFIGLTGSLFNLLGFLNLAELGVGSAIGCLLFKPLHDHDRAEITNIISVMGYIYRWIGLIILGGGVILSCFLPLIFPASETGFPLALVYFAFYSFLASSLLGYFVNYRQNILGADQRNYVVTGYFQTVTILKTIIQMVVAKTTGSYYLWVAIEICFGIIYAIILNWKINQTYPWLKAKASIGRKMFRKYPQVMRKTKQVFIHQISTFVQYQTTPMLTYAFASLNVVALYGNYVMVTDKVIALMETAIGSFRASVGNLISEGDTPKSMRIFWEIYAIRFFFAGIIFFGIYCSMNPLITVWLGPDYTLGNDILVLMLLYYYLRITTGNTCDYLYGYGLFSDIWAPATQAALFAVIAIVGGHYLGLAGILLANVISVFLILGVWKPYYLYHEAFNVSVIRFWLPWIGLNLINAGCFAISYFISSFLIDFNHAENFFNWLLNTLIIATVYLAVSAIMFLSFSKSARAVLLRFKPMLNRLKSPKAQNI